MNSERLLIADQNLRSVAISVYNQAAIDGVETVKDAIARLKEKGVDAITLDDLNGLLVSVQEIIRKS